ncbi:Similar to conserved hypothetical protein [Paracoccidioides brasiliensis Pb01]; acc. no. XP_002797316 [Pyronema omphalodes CBS 100304]|uniref:Uncharacterized protein n=1 Tax=Pyronema omphalodes (strain CBS 100304) TaxID=1076935 RepID=U4L9D9_PYROM|nr:Similar to conserved hypothetical protein [Paracoccidioides brasiliensis Pb01]; acc. no. XP_002797316 [Pyronema omphalodes CBS 100304]
MDQYLRQGLETLKSGESQLRSGVESANNAMDSDARERQAEQVAYAERRREQREEEANPTSGVSKFFGGLMGGNEEEERRKREEEERRRREEEGSIGGMIGGLLGTKKQQEPKEYTMGDHIQGVFGGGRKAEDQEDMIDKGIDLIQERVFGAGPQDNEDAIEQAKDKMIGDFVRGQLSGVGRQ